MLDELSTLIGDIYDAALDPALWTDVLEKSSTFVGSRVAGEWAKPHDWIDAATALLANLATGSATARPVPDSVADDATRQRMTLLTPHMRRAILIGETIQINKAEADTLDHLASGVFLIDATGRLVQANRNGEAMMADGSVLRVASGRLIANDRPLTRRCVRHWLAMTAPAREASQCRCLQTADSTMWRIKDSSVGGSSLLS